MKSFHDYLHEVDTMDTLHDPGIRSYYSRHRVTLPNRKEFELIRKAIMIAIESGQTARRRLRMMLRQLTSTVPEILPIVNQISTLDAQDARDARKLFDPKDVDDDFDNSGEEDDDDDPLERMRDERMENDTQTLDSWKWGKIRRDNDDEEPPRKKAVSKLPPDTSDDVKTLDSWKMPRRNK